MTSRHSLEPERVLALPCVALARTYCCYIALPDEIETKSLIEALWKASKAVSAPKITEPGQMVAVSIQSWADLEPGRFGILEPKHATPVTTPLDVIILPGQRFTRTGDRRGRGHGYYDRFLATHSNAFRIGLCTQEQLINTITVAPHDQSVDWILTEIESINTHARMTHEIPH